MNGGLLFCLATLTIGAQPAPNFDTEVLPVLTKAGCNAGACHGAAAGRGGFHLSLLGSDPAQDYQTIVQAHEGRRINLARPELSLLLAKPTGQLDHGGDVVLNEGEAGAERLRDWIKAGAPRGATRRLTRFGVAPARSSCTKLPTTIKLSATAWFDDGPAEDVTAWTVFVTSDTEAVTIDGDQATAVVRRRGQHVIIARFLDRVVPLQVMASFNDAPIDLSGQASTNYIDGEVHRLLTELRLPPSAPADDATFLRRLRLDLTGRLPSPEEIDFFLSDQSPEKRARLVDRLLDSEEFADYWTLRFARLLRLHGLPAESEGVKAYAKWLRECIASGTPMDAMARQLVTATGDAYTVGPANFARMVSDARAHAELVGRFFLGVRLGCANCHNHPLDKWTQDDYHGLAAVFARLERGRHVTLGARGAVTNPRTGEPAWPRIPGERNLEPGDDHLQALSEWIAGDQEIYFARATVNRLWQAMFGRGLIEPTDDLRDTNPATHPELLDRLARDFIDSGYQLRHTLRQIALSDTYARSDDTNPQNQMDDRFYSHAFRRALPPEVLADAIADVTGVADTFAGWPTGTRAVQLVDPLVPAPALEILGRCSRVAMCDDNPEAVVGVATQLHLINGELINRKLESPQGRLGQMIQQQNSDAEIVEHFFLRAWSRRPTPTELTRWCSRLAGPAGERTQRLEDFVWSLLNSRRFVSNQ